MPSFATNVARKMTKQLLKTGMVFAASLLLMSFSTELGIIVMMLYSSWMVVKSSRHELPLNTFTALLPGAISLCCFLFMLWFVGVYKTYMPVMGVLLGIFPGLLMARGHRIYEKNGRTYAKRTSFYILIWTGSLLFTQGATLFGLRQIMDFGFLLNGFSTTMAVILSFFLFSKATSGPSAPAGGSMASLLLVALSLSLFTLAVPRAEALNIGDPVSDPNQLVLAGRHVFGPERGHLIEGNRAKTQETAANKLVKNCMYGVSYTLGTKRDSGGEVRFTLGNVRMNPSALSQAKYQEELRTSDAHFHKMAADYSGRMYRPERGTFGNGGQGVFYIIPIERENFDDIVTVIAIWKHGDWVLGFTYVGIPSQYKSLIGNNPKQYLNGMIGRVQRQVESLSIGGSSPAPAPQPQPQLQPQPQPQPEYNSQEQQDADDTMTFEEVLENIEVQSFEDYWDQQQAESDEQSNSQDEQGEQYGQDELEDALDQMLSVMEDALNSAGFSEGAAAAGLAVALVQLLAGLGMTAAYTAAVDVAAAVDQAFADAAQAAPPSQGETVMLDGAAAQKWMEDNGYNDKDRFDAWKTNPDQGDLHGIAGFENADGDINDLVILVSKSQPDQPEAETNDTDQTDLPDQTDQTDQADQAGQTDQADQDQSDDLRPPDVDRHDDTLLPDEPPQPEPPQPTTPEQLAILKDKIQETINDKKMEGYYVRNREFDVAPVVDKILWAGNKAINNIGNWIGSPLDAAAGWTGGQCGEYGEWGVKWSQKTCEDTFGEGTIMTQITSESSTSNHNATRVITPDGERFVIDYWQGMQDKQTVYTEKEWIAQQTKAGRPNIVRSWSGDSADICTGGEEGALNNYINRYGEEEGIEKFRKGAGKDLSPAKREALILSYQKSPWPTK